MSEIIDVDYKEVYVSSESDAAALHRTEIEINALTLQANQMALTYIIAIGQRLSDAKDMVEHGSWGKWCSERINYSQSTAENYIKLYKEYGAEQINLFNSPPSDKIMNLPYSKALALLAVPQEEREDFVEENEVEKISVRELKDIIKKKDEEINGLNKDISRQKKKNKALKQDADRDKTIALKKIEELELKISELESSEKETVDDSSTEIERLKKELETEKAEIRKLEMISENSSKLHVINMLLENLQDIYYKIVSGITEVRDNDPSLADKLTVGVREMFKDFMFELGEEGDADETR